MYQIGETVAWSSQAVGVSKRKVGTVVEVVQPGEYPDRERFARLYSGSGVGMSRDHVSYVVEVDQGAGRMPKHYWPRVSALGRPLE